MTSAPNGRPSGSGCLWQLKRWRKRQDPLALSDIPWVMQSELCFLPQQMEMGPPSFFFYGSRLFFLFIAYFRLISFSFTRAIPV